MVKNLQGENVDIASLCIPLPSGEPVTLYSVHKKLPRFITLKFVKRELNLPNNPFPLRR